MKKTDELTEKQTAFLDALFGEANGDIGVALDMAGYSRSRKMSVLKSLKSEIIERAELQLASNAPKATMKLGELLDNPTTLGAKEIVSTSREILDRVGLVKVDRQEMKIEAPSGLFFLPAKNTAETVKDDDGES